MQFEPFWLRESVWFSSACRLLTCRPFTSLADACETSINIHAKEKARETRTELSPEL